MDNTKYFNEDIKKFFKKIEKIEEYTLENEKKFFMSDNSCLLIFSDYDILCNANNNTDAYDLSFYLNHIITLDNKTDFIEKLYQKIRRSKKFERSSIDKMYLIERISYN